MNALLEEENGQLQEQVDVLSHGILMRCVSDLSPRGGAEAEVNNTLSWRDELDQTSTTPSSIAASSLGTFGTEVQHEADFERLAASLSQLEIECGRTMHLQVLIQLEAHQLRELHCVVESLVSRLSALQPANRSAVSESSMSDYAAEQTVPAEPTNAPGPQLVSVTELDFGSPAIAESISSTTASEPIDEGSSLQSAPELIADSAQSLAHRRVTESADPPSIETPQPEPASAPTDVSHSSSGPLGIRKLAKPTMSILVGTPDPATPREGGSCFRRASPVPALQGASAHATADLDRASHPQDDGAAVSDSQVRKRKSARKLWKSPFLGHEIHVVVKYGGGPGCYQFPPQPPLLMTASGSAVAFDNLPLPRSTASELLDTPELRVAADSVQSRAYRKVSESADSPPMAVEFGSKRTEPAPVMSDVSHAVSGPLSTCKLATPRMSILVGTVPREGGTSLESTSSGSAHATADLDRASHPQDDGAAVSESLVSKQKSARKLWKSPFFGYGDGPGDGHSSPRPHLTMTANGPEVEPLIEGYTLQLSAAPDTYVLAVPRSEIPAPPPPPQPSTPRVFARGSGVLNMERSAMAGVIGGNTKLGVLSVPRQAAVSRPASGSGSTRPWGLNPEVPSPDSNSRSRMCSQQAEGRSEPPVGLYLGRVTAAETSVKDAEPRSESPIEDCPTWPLSPREDEPSSPCLRRDHLGVVVMDL
jgi:hypothetical protein